MKQKHVLYALKLIVLFAVHYGAGRLALQTDLVVFAETLTWLPAGLAMAAVLLWGPAVWPAVAASAYAITISDGGPVVSGVVSALSNAGGAVTGSFLLRKGGFRNSLERTRDVLLLAVLGGVVAPLVTATSGAALLKFFGRLPHISLAELWWLWWRGDSLAILLLTPVILVWGTTRPGWEKRRRWEALGVFLAMAGVSLTVFGLWPFSRGVSPPFAYLHFPLLIWVAMRLGLHGVTAANLLLLLITGWGTAEGLGPFARTSVESTLILHWAFLGATSLSSLLLGATVREQQGTSEALRQSEERYRDFMEQSPDGIWRLELEKPLSLSLTQDQQFEHLAQYNVLAECNDAFARMYGFKAGREMAGRRIQEFLPASDPRNVEFVRSLIRAGYQAHQVESHEMDRDGRPKYFLNNIVGIIEGGKVARIWGTQRDITENRLLEDQLRQAQKMEAVGRLAGGVAHDFNNLLMVIGGHGELLRDEARGQGNMSKHAEAILKAADRAGRLTRQLLAFGRKQVLQPKVLDLNAVVNDTGKLLRRLIGEHIELRFQLQPDLGRVKADPGQIEQVLMNLAINARDAMPDGGKLTIETANVTLGEDSGREHPAPVPGDYVLVAVSDTGQGMDEKTRARIFEPFFTTKEMGQGTGLGLATVYGIVKQSGGYIWAHSELGHGSVFTVYLPRVQEAAEATLQLSAEKLPGGTETILVAEDEQGVRELACDFLKSHGYTVLEAHDPAHALKIAQENSSRIHLLVTDVVMPGMRGTELAEHIAEINPALRVLYISGYTGNAIALQGDLAQGTYFLSKPFTREALLRKTRQVLDGPAPIPAAR
jgi:PAS domain S-box-containing protein